MPQLLAALMYHEDLEQTLMARYWTHLRARPGGKHSVTRGEQVQWIRDLACAGSIWFVEKEPGIE